MALVNEDTTDQNIGPGLIMSTILALEAIVSFHTLWPGYDPCILILFLWVPTAALLRGNTHMPIIFLGLGQFLGEFIGYCLIVPPVLSMECLSANRYQVGGTLLLRLVSLALYLLLFQKLRCLSRQNRIAGQYKTSKCVLWFLVGIVIMPSLALIHAAPTRLSEEAQVRARDQLGTDFSDYRFFVRDLQTFHAGQYMKVKAQLIAYRPELGSRDLEDVTVEWKEP